MAPVNVPCGVTTDCPPPPDYVSPLIPGLKSNFDDFVLVLLVGLGLIIILHSLFQHWSRCRVSRKGK